jgi:hypothetical protein
MTLACWPNEGWATIARIVESGSRPRDGDKRGLTGSFEYAGDRPSQWQAAEGVWLQGYWCYDRRRGHQGRNNRYRHASHQPGRAARLQSHAG